MNIFCQAYHVNICTYMMQKLKRHVQVAGAQDLASGFSVRNYFTYTVEITLFNVHRSYIYTLEDIISLFLTRNCSSLYHFIRHSKLK